MARLSELAREPGTSRAEPFFELARWMSRSEFDSLHERAESSSTRLVSSPIIDDAFT
jgi:hypothetical protein